MPYLQSRTEMYTSLGLGNRSRTQNPPRLAIEILAHSPRYRDTLNPEPITDQIKSLLEEL